jgi:uncharacterized integral membrane protein
MQIFVVVAVVIAILAVIFALQNLTVVTVTFFFWNAHASLALVLLITLAAGVLISLLASLPGLVRGKWISSSQKKKLAGLESERSAYLQRAEIAEKDVRQLEEQLASYSAELDKQQTEAAPPPEDDHA